MTGVSNRRCFAFSAAAQYSASPFCTMGGSAQPDNHKSVNQRTIWDRLSPIKSAKMRFPNDTGSNGRRDQCLWSREDANFVLSRECFWCHPFKIRRLDSACEVNELDYQIVRRMLYGVVSRFYATASPLKIMLYLRSWDAESKGRVHEVRTCMISDKISYILQSGKRPMMPTSVDWFWRHAILSLHSPTLIWKQPNSDLSRRTLISFWRQEFLSNIFW